MKQFNSICFIRYILSNWWWIQMLVVPTLQFARFHLPLYYILTTAALNFCCCFSAWISVTLTTLGFNRQRNSHTTTARRGLLVKSLEDQTCESKMTGLTPSCSAFRRRCWARCSHTCFCHQPAYYGPSFRQRCSTAGKVTAVVMRHRLQ